MAVRRGVGFAVGFVLLLVAGILLGSPPLLIAAAIAAGFGLVFLSGGGWRAWLVLATLALLAAGIAYGQLDGLLAHMHRFGHASYSLSSIGARSGEPKVAFDAVRGWAEWTSEPGVTDLYASPRHVVDLALAMDAVVIVSLASILILLMLRVRRALKGLSTSGRTPEEKAESRMLAGGICLVVIAVVADGLEDLGYWGAVHHFWSAASESSGPWWVHFLVAANWWLTLAKFSAYGLAVIALVVGATGLRRSVVHKERAVGVWRSAKILRGQIAITLVLGGVFVLHPQAADVIRRWNIRQGVIAYMLAIVLVLIAWAFGKRLMTIPARPRGP